MKALSKTLLVASLAGVSWLGLIHGQAAVAGGLYDVYVESAAGSGTYTKLTQLGAFTAPTTVQSFYNYQLSNFSFNGSTLLSSLKPNFSNLFLVEGTNGVSLGFIHNANGNPNGVGGLIRSEFVLSSNLSGVAPSSNFKVIDDFVDDPTRIDNIPNSSDLRFTSLNGWGTAFTDGGLIGDLSETNAGITNNNWSITSKFIPIITGAGALFPSSGITNWSFLSPVGTSVATTNLFANRPNYNLLSELNANKSSFKVLITPSTSSFIPTPAFSVTGGSGFGTPGFGLPPITPAATTPEPSALISLVMIGLMGGGAVVRSRFSKSEE